MNFFRLLLIGLLICLTTSIYGQQAQWLTDLELAQKSSKEGNKPIIMNFTGSDWCDWCMKLKSEIFSDPKFKSYAKDNLVLLEVDFPQHKPQSDELKLQNAKLEREYAIEALPTVLIISPDGKKLGQLSYEPGGAENWLKDLKSITK